MDAYGVPRSPASSFDEEQMIAEEYAMQEAERRQQQVQQPVPDEYAQAEGALFGDSGGEEGYEYDEETVEEGVALGEAMASGSGGAASSSNAFVDLERNWQANLPQYRKRTEKAAAEGQQRKKKSRHITITESDDGLDDRVERTGTAYPAGSASGGDDAASADDESDETGNGEASATQPSTYVDARSMTGYNAQHYGHSVTAKIPEFRHGSASNSTWMSYTDAKEEVNGMTPVRAMCWNVPAELFSFDSTRFRHWTTPEGNPTRANNIASILSFCFTGTSKGFLSGAHEELQRANGEADEDSEQQEKEKKKPSRVHRYAFMLPTDNYVTVPMFVLAYEELYNRDLSQVTCIRIWKFVFDKSHSDSELCRKLLDENRDTFANAGVAHAPNVTRRKQLVAEQKQNRQQTGGTRGAHALEYFAGMQYVGITNQQIWFERLQSYGGKNMHNSGRPFFDERELPKGIHNKQIQPDRERGGTHPYSPEFVFQAKRTMSFMAGTVDMTNCEPLDIHPDFLDPSKYWTDRGEFVLPSVSQKNDGFFFMVNPYVTNIFDAPLPRPIYGSACAGPHLLKLYRECFYDEVMAAGGTNASVSDCFNAMMTQQDQAALDMAKQMSETIISYDSIDATEIERKGLRHYGEVDMNNSFIVEPRQTIKKIAQETRRILSNLIQPWIKQREELRTLKHEQLKRNLKRMKKKGLSSIDELEGMEESEDEEEEEEEEAEDMECDYHDKLMEEVRDVEDGTTVRHCSVMKDLVCLHLNRIEEAFRSKTERETIPQGWIAMFDGLQAELSRMPNESASVAFAHDVQLQFDDISSFSHMNLWLGEFFEHDCFIEGRDRRIMDELFLHLFEQYGDVTFLLLLCGYKGNGKTVRTERAMAVFPPNWVTAGGPASARAGMNGQSDSTNGKNVIYDEMVDELCEADGSDRLEFWKQIVLKREYTYNRTVPVKNADGTETHKTMKLRTPHDETHCICTNYGMAFTKNGDPTDTKFAMIDRSIAHLVRSIGKKAHTDSEFNEHMSKPEQQKKLTRFRIFVCLVGATKLAIKGVPAFQPNLALANKMFDYLDNQMIVGEYNLPRRTPRKSLKREENLKTMAIMKVVADVFIYKQTAVEFESGKLGLDGKPQPFKFNMLWDVIRQLRATPELIFIAWSQSLDYNIGTAAHTFAAMTALCEKFKLCIGDWFKKPPSTDLDEVRRAGPQSPTVEYPQRQEGQADSEYQEAVQTYNLSMNSKAVHDNIAQLPRMLDCNGVSREDRLQLLMGFERQRRATSLYRHTCTLDGNSDLQMHNPVELIEKVMQKHGNPPDLEDGIAGTSGSSGEYLPIYSSAIMASTVQLCTLYNYQAVVHWCASDACNPMVVGNSMVGTKIMDNITYAQRKTDGPCKWNTAWMRMDGADGWKKFAYDTVHSNVTCKIFDLPNNGLRDLFYLLSTRDNSRRCTEEPDLPYHMSKSAAFVDGKNQAVTDSYIGPIRMAGMRDARGRAVPAGSEERRRHPYAKVPDMPLQRSIDMASNNGRLPAVMPMISNNVRDAPPVRMISDGEKKYVEINTSAALEHTKMLAEASFRCSLHPGMENMQEAFCEGAQGPEGLCISLEGVSGDPSSKKCTTFAYSYDMLTISFTLDAMSRYYDPDMEDYCEMYADAFKDSLDFDPKVENLPHMSMRFVGFKDERSRRLLSVPLKKQRDKAFSAVEVSDETENPEDFHTMHTHLQLSLGHEPSDEEIERYQKARSGARSMSGVSGDLLSMSTYKEHTLTTLKERGMISGEDDIVMHMVVDDPYGLRMRVAEIAGKKINELVKKQPSMKKAKKFMPPNHADLTDEQIIKMREVECHRVRTKLYSNMELPNELEPLRKYAPLDVGDLSKMTYHNREKDAERLNSKVGAGKKKAGVDASSQFKDQARFRKNTLPGRASATGSQAGSSGGVGGISIRGRQDSRDARAGPRRASAP